MKNKWKKYNYWIFILCFLFTCVPLTACTSSDDLITGDNKAVQDSELDSTRDSAKTTETEVKEEAENPEDSYILSYEANTIDGEAFTSEKFAQSKLSMINVWATYCNPCLTEMPDLSEIAAEYATSDLQMIGIISDVTEDSRDGVQTAKELIAETGADNYPHLLLNDSLYNNLIGGISSVPTTFFVNQKGEVLGYIVGANTKETWEEIINELLEETN